MEIEEEQDIGPQRPELETPEQRRIRLSILAQVKRVWRDYIGYDNVLRNFQIIIYKRNIHIADGTWRVRFQVHSTASRGGSQFYYGDAEGTFEDEIVSGNLKVKIHERWRRINFEDGQIVKS